MNKKKIFSSNSFVISGIMRIFAAVKHTTLMITRRECISKIIPYKDEIMSKYGVRSMHIFGSVARSEQSESSDVDVCVDMKPNLLKRSGLKQYLEQLLGCNVDVIRIHPNMDVILKNQIDHDRIFVFG